MRLAELTWPQAERYFAQHDTVVIGVGSIECHGRHMPLGTDTIIPDHLLADIEGKTDALICPTLPYGATEYLGDFPGTVNLGPELLYQVLSRVCGELYRHGARRFVILNGHGGNRQSIERVGFELQRRGALLALLNWWLMAWDLNPAWKGGHGGGEETAAILGINPDLVDQSELHASAELRDLSDEIKADGMAAARYKGVQISVPRVTASLTQNGWIGPDHPATATERWGKEMLAASSAYIADFIRAFQKVDLEKACRIF